MEPNSSAQFLREAYDRVSSITQLPPARIPNLSHRFHLGLLALKGRAILLDHTEVGFACEGDRFEFRRFINVNLAEFIYDLVVPELNVSKIAGFAIVVPTMFDCTLYQSAATGGSLTPRGER